MKNYLPFSKQLERELEVRAWSQEKLAGMLSVDPRTVRRWIAGERSPTLRLREELCRVLGKKSVEELGLFEMESDEAEKGYPMHPEGALSFVPGTVGSSPLTSLPTTDEKLRAILRNNAVVDHMQLFGVDEPMKRLREFLNAPSGGWIISLHGEGGIGKTALAYEIAARFAANAGFTRVAWVSAKTSQLLPDGRWLRSSSAELRWAQLVKKMADQLGIVLGENSAGWLRDFPRAIRALPPGEKCLLIVDNLETVDDINEVINFLCGSTTSTQIVKPHKIFITTR